MCLDKLIYTYYTQIIVKSWLIVEYVTIWMENIRELVEEKFLSVMWEECIMSIGVWNV
jgi:hypothetical protein